MPTGYLYIAGVPASLLGQAMPALALTEDQGAGGIVTSLADLTTWDRALYQGQLLPPPQQRQLESLVSVAAGKPIGNTTLAVNSATAADNDDVADLAGSVYQTLEKEGAVHAS
jgi:D-alanyl-D-alanine carboxypeptidase